MTPDTTALLLIEYQNDFVSEGGAQHDAVKVVMAESDMLAHSHAVTRQARARGVTVMHAAISFADGYPEVPTEPYGILAGIRQAKAFRQGSWGAAIADVMAPVEGDIIIEGKRGLDCFASTNIDFILRQRGITTLAIAGFLTNCSVESTMRSAYERGFEVMTLVDCTATLSPEAQSAAIEGTFPMFSRPMTHDQFIANLEASA